MVTHGYQITPKQTECLINSSLIPTLNTCSNDTAFPYYEIDACKLKSDPNYILRFYESQRE
jgi:hypothetical protein